MQITFTNKEKFKVADILNSNNVCEIDEARNTLRCLIKGEQTEKDIKFLQIYP